MKKEETVEPSTAKKVREENEEWHDKESEMYDQIRSELWNFHEQKRISQDLDKIDNLVNGNKVIDIGCGTGNLVLKFSQMQYKVDGVDISEKMLKTLRSKLNGDHRGPVNLHCSDAKSYLERTDKSDVICFSSVLHHLPHYFDSLHQAISKLNSQGVIYIVHEPLPAKDPDRHSFLKFVDKLLTPKSTIHELLAPDKESDSVDYHIDVKEGVKLSDIIDFLKEEGLTIKEVEKYSTWNSGVLCVLDDKLGFTRKSDFKLIAQKD